MKGLKFILILLILSPLCLSAQDKLIIHDANAQERKLPSFSKINISGGIDLYLTPDERQTVVVSGEGIKTEVNGSELKVYSERSFKMGKRRVYISIPVLEKLVSSGASDVYVKGILTGKDLQIHFNGASDFSGAVKVENLVLQQSGSSDITLSGSVTQMDLVLSGASDLNGFDCKVEVLNATVSGASQLDITVHKELNVTASGASDVRYKGRAVLKKQITTGASSIKSVDSE